jgi:hypothetical protein
MDRERIEGAITWLGAEIIKHTIPGSAPCLCDRCQSLSFTQEVLKRISVERLLNIIIRKARQSDVFNKNGEKIGNISLLSDFEGLAQSIHDEIVGKEKE